MSSRCSCGKRLPPARVWPLHCSCGAVYQAGDVAQCLVAPPRPRTVGTILREMVGCGCPIGWRKWDRRGLDWCRGNADEIAKRLTAEPKPGLSAERAAEMVQLAIEIASRQAGDGQQANQAGLSE